MEGSRYIRKYTDGYYIPPRKCKFGENDTEATIFVNVKVDAGLAKFQNSVIVEVDEDRVTEEMLSVFQEVVKEKLQLKVAINEKKRYFLIPIDDINLSQFKIYDKKKTELA